jgi:hypothetical protein
MEQFREIAENRNRNPEKNQTCEGENGDACGYLTAPMHPPAQKDKACRKANAGQQSQD